MIALSSPHVQNPVAREIYVVRVDGFTHYVPKTSAGRIADALCGKKPQNLRHVWTFAKRVTDGNVCMTCFHLACLKPSRIVFPF